MASTVTVNGYTTGRSGVISAPQYQDSEGRSGTRFKVASIIAELPFLEQGKPVFVGTRAAMERLDPSSDDLKLLADILWNPSNDPRLGSGPDGVWVTSPTASTQASLPIQDALSATVLTAKSLAWGKAGNRTLISIDKSGSAYDVSVSRDGISFSDAGVSSSGAVCSAITNTSVTGLPGLSGVMSVDTTGLLIDSAQPNIPNGGPYAAGDATFDPTKLVVSGPVTVGFDGAPAGSVAVAVTGINAANGQLATETITVAAPAATSTGVISFSSYVSMSVSNVGYAGTSTVSSRAFEFLLADKDYSAAEMGSAINLASSKGWLGGALDPGSAGVLLSELDVMVPTVISNTSTAPTCALALARAVRESLNRSGMVEATLALATPGHSPPASVPLSNASGGTEGTATAADYGAAMNATNDFQINFVVPMSTDADVHSQLLRHVTRGGGAEPRQGWVGFTDGSSLTDVLIKSRALGSDALTAYFQKQYRKQPDGTSRWLGPEYSALEAVAIHCALPVAEPVNYKFGGASEYSQAASIVLDDDIERLIQAGVTTLMPSANGWRYERELTTWNLNDDVNRTDTSSKESVNAFLRFLKSYVESRIGTKSVSTTAARIAISARSAGVEALNQEMIRGFDPRSVEIEDQGAVFIVHCKVQAAVPVLNIITAPLFEQVSIQVNL